MAKNRRRAQKKRTKKSQCQVIPINVLPDDILLEIFDFRVDQDASRQFIFSQREIKTWQTLVHVCRRWRNIVFRSPLRLNLTLLCTAKTPTRDTLDVWPPLPLVILSHSLYGIDSDFSTEHVDNIIAVLEHSDRVCQISLINVPDSHFQELLAAAQEPFSELTHLLLSSHGEPVIPDSFLGGSALRLQDIWLHGIAFPSLPKLLLSATHLVHLYLQNIPHSGYISPKAMATTLSTLTCLRILILEFQSPQSFPDWESRHPPPLTRSVLPVLTNFTFKGVSDYLEYLVARIDAPQLYRSHITFFNQILFDTPQFIQFIGRTSKLEALEKAHVSFGDDAAMVNLSSLTSNFSQLITVKIPCIDLDWQVSSLEQVFTSSLPPLFALEDLYIHKHPDSQRDRRDNVENALWLELFQPFPTVKNLYLCVGFAPRIVPALQELVGDRTTEVMPDLQNIFLEELQLTGPVREGIQPFVAARQVINHPIAVSRWDYPDRDKSSVLG